MSRLTWTDTQLGRLKELDAGRQELNRAFGTEKERDRAFQELEKQLAASARQKLEQLRAELAFFLLASDHLSRYFSLTLNTAACRLSRRLFSPTTEWKYFGLLPWTLSTLKLSAITSSFVITIPPSP